MDTRDGSGPLPGGAAASEPAGGDPLAWAQRAQALALLGLFGLAVLYTLYIASTLLLPIVLATVMGLILRPIIRALKRVYVPEWLGALVVLLLLSGGLAWAATTLAGPARAWMEAAPQVFRRIEARVRVVKDAVHDIGQATTQVENLTTVGPPSEAVAVNGPGLGAVLLSNTWDVIATLGMVMVLAYFLLASGDLFLRKLVSALPRLRDRKLAVTMTHEIQANVSAYLFTVSLINVVLGAAVGAAMFALGMPNPLLWGAMAALLNFIPFIGPLVALVVVFGVALLTFNTLPAALPPVLAFAALHLLEGSFLTPLILSRRFTLNPVVVVLGLLFWGWIWGIPGVLLAMPLLVSLKILCDHVPGLAVVGDFLASERG